MPSLVKRRWPLRVPMVVEHVSDLRWRYARQRELRNVALVKEVYRICLVTTSLGHTGELANEEKFVRIKRNWGMTCRLRS